MNRAPKYWIGVACLNHIQRGAELGMFGIGHGKRQPLEPMAPGDKIVFYAPKIDHTKTDKANISQKFKGFGTLLDQPIFSEEIAGACVFGRKILFDRIDQAAPIQPLIDQLDFILNKAKWGFPFLRGYVEISQKDWDLIVSQLG
jgi:EVE domain